jgi:hypothetical protein
VIVASLILAVGLHADWHLARQHHGRWSLNWGLNWPYHWVATAALFGIVGWVIARRYPVQRWRIGVIAVVVAIVLAQVIDPIVEAAVYQGRFGFSMEPARWVAFWQALGAAVPVYALALWLGAKRVAEVHAG